MTHTERLINSSNNPLARELLRAAELDRAPENTAAKVALALGLGSSAVVTTIAASAAASGGLATGTSSTVVASAVAAPAAGVAGAVAAAPVAASAVTAVGMIKVMAAVSLACGTLSYGGVKLALKATEKPAITQQASSAASTAVMRRTASKPQGHSVGAFPDISDSESVAEANLPAPPPPPNRDETDVAAARNVEPIPVVAANTVAHRDTDTTASGRHGIQENTSQRAREVERVTQVRTPSQNASADAAHAASFPSDEAHPTVPQPVPNANPPVAPNALELEVAQLDHARAALAAGQPVQALRELDVYRTRTPRGALAAESVVLRVKALLALGQRTAAEAEARPLLVTAPQSRHAERLRSLLNAANAQ